MKYVPKEVDDVDEEMEITPKNIKNINEMENSPKKGDDENYEKVIAPKT